jgi:hypothetical protein
MARLATVTDAAPIREAWSLVRLSVAGWWPDAMGEVKPTATFEDAIRHKRKRYYIEPAQRGWASAAFFQVILGAEPPGDEIGRRWEQMDIWVLPPGLSDNDFDWVLSRLFIAWFDGAISRKSWFWGTLPNTAPARSLDYARRVGFRARPHPEKDDWTIWEGDPVVGKASAERLLAAVIP